MTVQEKKILLTTLSGTQYHVHAGSDQRYIQQLPGCILKATGVSIFTHFYIDSWSVQDAGSGSAPFLGLLERQGIQWVIKDHNTKGLVILDDLEELIEPIQGQVILVGGYVIGPQRIKVVSARYLTGEN